MLIFVKAHPGSKKEEIIKKGEYRYEAYVKEKPEEGKANDALKRLFSDYFGIPLKAIILKRGAKKRNKIFEIILL